jgi:hypothetical protein
MAVLPMQEASHNASTINYYFIIECFTNIIPLSLVVAIKRGGAEEEKERREKSMFMRK